MLSYKKQLYLRRVKMFSREFEIFICAALAIITVLLFFGKADFMIKSKDAAKANKRTPAEQLKFSRGVSCFTGVWLIAELGLLFFGDVGRWVSLIYLGIVILNFVGLIIFSRKQS